MLDYTIPTWVSMYAINSPLRFARLVSPRRVPPAVLSERKKVRCTVSPSTDDRVHRDNRGKNKTPHF